MISCNLVQTAAHEGCMCIYDQPACTFLLLYGRYSPCLTIQVLHFTIHLLTLAPAAKVTVQNYCKLTNTSSKQVAMFPVLWTPC